LSKLAEEKADQMTIKEEDTVKVKGKSQPVTLYSVRSDPHD
jgi:hypothetical protein